MSQKVKVRNTLVSDIKTLIALQKRVYPSIPAWREDMLHHQLTVFPQGQMVAEVDGQLVGAASSLVVLWDEWEVQHTWQDITSLGSFDTHNPAGRTLYAAEVFVNPEQRGSGIGHAIYQARRRLCRQLNLKRIIACGRLPGYHHYAAQMTAELYVQKVLCATRCSAFSCAKDSTIAALSAVIFPRITKAWAMPRSSSGSTSATTRKNPHSLLKESPCESTNCSNTVPAKVHQGLGRI
jgi:GNAT superfamily N-acetyltransferase